jgi:hypothetical protein
MAERPTAWIIVDPIAPTAIVMVAESPVLWMAARPSSGSRRAP